MHLSRILFLYCFYIYFWHTVFIRLHVCVVILWPLHFGWRLVLGLHKEDNLQMSFWHHWQPSYLSTHPDGRSIACPIRLSLYIYLLYNIYYLCFTCIDFYDLYAWGGYWFVIYIRRVIYKFLNVCPFDFTAVAGSRKVGPVNQVNHTSWVAVVTPTDRPKSVRSRCVIELFWRCLCCHFTFLLV